MEIKLTPFIMFLFILAVLIISMLIGNYFNLKDKTQFAKIENFNSFEYGTYGKSGPVYPLDTPLPWYSSKKDNIYVLYDSILFDLKNGNLIEVHDTVKGNLKTSSSSSTIDQIFVNTRFNIASIVDMTSAKTTSDKWDTKTQSASIPFIYRTQSSSLEKYNVIYVPFGLETYIHIIGKTTLTNGNNTNLLSIYASKDANQLQQIIYPTTSTIQSSQPIKSDSKYDNISKFKLPSGNSYYSSNANLYSLNSQIFYDCDKGVVCVSGISGTKYYDRVTGVASDTLSSSYVYNTKPGELHSWMTQSEPYVLCMTCGNETAILYLTSNSSGNLNINNYVLLNKIVTSSSNQSVVSAYVPHHRSVDNTVSGYDSDSESDTYNKKKKRYKRKDMDVDNYLSNDPKLFFATCGSDKKKWNYHCMQAFYNIANPNSSTDKLDFNYIKKTEIVPPVCPMCPNCPGSGVCTYCGGAGGAGCGGSYIDSHGNTVSGGGDGESKKKNYTKVGSGTLESTADPDTIGGSLTLGQLDFVAGVEDVATTGAGVINKTVDTAGNLAGKVVDSATGLAAGAGALVGAAGYGAYDLTKRAGEGAYNLTTGAASGANSLLRDTGSGIAHLGDGHDLSRDGYYNNSNSVRSGGSAGGAGSAGGGGGSAGGGGGAGKDKPIGPVDAYSYYGALPSKGSANFMPVTADFSSFRK